MQWQTAAQSDREGAGLWQYLIKMWTVVALGAALLVFSPVIIGKSAGFMWLLSPAAAAALALPAYKGTAIAARDRELLRSAMAACWRYLKDFSAAEDNFLPPDNFQEQPPTGAAHRTSPTK